MAVSQILTEFSIAPSTQKRLSNDLFPLVGGTAGATCSLASSFSGKSASVSRLFVAVSADYADTNLAASSTDGITWTQRYMPAYLQWRGVAVNPKTGVYAAISYGGTAASSTDGMTWTARGITSAYWRAITCNPTTGVFVAVAIFNISTQVANIAASSTDGITWTQRTLPTNARWSCVTCNSATGVFVALSTQNSTVAASSTDGITWTQRTILQSSWSGVTVNPNTGIFVAVTGGGAVSSTDGITWTLRSTGEDVGGALTAVTCNPTTGLYVACAEYTPYIIRSTDGITWTRLYTSPSYGVTGGNSVAVNKKTGVFVIGPLNSSVGARSIVDLPQYWDTANMPSSALLWFVTGGAS